MCSSDLIQAWEAFYANYDLLICPAASTAAFPHDHSQPRESRLVPVNGRPRPSIEQVFWPGLAGPTYQPVTVAPIGSTSGGSTSSGSTSGGLPIGAQIVGPQYGDATCLRFARLLEQEFRAFTPPPDYAL